mmetsp:Transcript_732/g.2951  ORF Transcript_732/g.2951 Transcript_732/m.2951 type:complete len:715 (-) Transcript_732:570-2714(-)
MRSALWLLLWSCLCGCWSPRAFQMPPKAFRAAPAVTARRSSASQAQQRPRDTFGDSRVVQWNKKLHSLAKKGKHRDALETLRTMQQKGISPTVVSHNHILQAFARAKDFDSVHQYLRRMESDSLQVEPNAFSYGIAVSSAAKHGAPDVANQLVANMIKKQIRPNVVVMGALVDAHEKAGDWLGALRALLMMANLGIAPNIIAYNSALSACGRSFKTDEALAILHLLRDKDIPPSVFRKEDDGSGESQSFAALLDALQRQVAGAMPDPDEITYSTVLIALQRAQRFESVQHLFEEMLLQEESDSLIGLRAITCYLNACSQLGDGEKASRMLRISQDRFGVVPDNYHFAMAIAANGRCKDWREAVRLVEEDLPQYGLEPDEFVLSTAVKACALPTSEAWTKGLALYEEYLERAEAGEVLTGAAMQAAATGGSTAAALAILRRWESRESSSSAVLYNTALGATLRSSPPDVETARILFEKMKGRVGNAPSPDIISYGTAIAVEARVGGEESVDRILDLLASMRSRQLRPNEKIYGLAMNAVCNAAPSSTDWDAPRTEKNSSKKWNAAVGLLRKALADKVEPTSAIVNPVFSTLSGGPPPQPHQLKQALQLFRALEASGHRVASGAIESLVDGLITFGDGTSSSEHDRDDRAWSAHNRIRMAVKLLRILRERSETWETKALDRHGLSEFPTQLGTKLVTIAERYGSFLVPGLPSSTCA